MWGRPIRRVALTFAVVVPVACALPAGAATNTTTIQTRFNQGGTQAFLQDGACPDTHLDGDPSEPIYEETNEIDAGWQLRGNARIGLSLCWDNSSALGGNCVDRGTFSYSTPTGRLKGTVRGCETFTNSDPFTFTLTITHSTGDLEGTTGPLAYAGCQPNGGALVAKLKTGSARPPAVCFD
jgi:hypothetical protein